MKSSDLERRALLGDWKAQRICTQLQIPLPCPCCGGSSAWKSTTRRDGNCSYEVAWIECKECGLRTREIQVSDYYNGKQDPAVALSAWNRRHAPPIGRCKDCIHYFQSECLKIYDDGACSKYARQTRKPDDFCSYFEEAPNG